ncbi:MAG: carbon starvation protein A [Succinivibrio sp.]|nr:carbon starvation protein A [Succinivibrio sp.]
MTGSLILCICLAYFVAAYFFYGGFLKRVFSIDPKRPTPAHTNYDGVDYVPTPKMVLFGHHFASIAGPGPIVGPIMAAYFGWLPALIWILIGCVFVGAFHDFAALVISARNRGRSISFVMEKLMGFSGRQLFLLFCFCCLLLVVAIFTNMIAGMFVKIPEVATASLIFICLAPLFFIVTYRFKVRLTYASVVFVPLVYLTVFIGANYPFDLITLFGLSDGTARIVWMLILALYIFLASVIPVQWLLQPRDYLNSWLLYGMLLLAFAAIFAYAPSINMNSFNGWSAVTADGNLTSMFPALFIFIACGACSGFHALVASGTTVKQIDSEKDMLPVGYGAMLLEGVLGVVALIAVMSMSNSDFAEFGKNPTVAFATGISNFSSALGISVAYAKIFISLAIAAFMMTSLDTATRLGRFLCQEIFMPRSVRDNSESSEDSVAEGNEPVGFRRILTDKYFASFIIVSISMLMGFSGSAAVLWPIFGASNQLMAAITFLIITLWLLMKDSKWYLSFIPMIFMTVMSLWGVVQVVVQHWGSNHVLAATGIVLIIMAIMMIMLGISIMYHKFKGTAAKTVELTVR